MPYTVDFSTKSNFIYVTVSGKQSLEDNISLASACIEICAKNKIGLILLDITGLTGQPGTMADYELAKLLNAWGAGKVVKKAAMVENEVDIAAGRFFETAAKNRNVNLSVFTDKVKAEEWLLEG